MALEQKVVPPKQELISFEIDEKTEAPPTFEDILQKSLITMLQYANDYVNRVANWIGLYLIIEENKEDPSNANIVIQHLFRIQDTVFERWELPKLTNSETNEVIFEPNKEDETEFLNYSVSEVRNIPVQHVSSHKMLPREVWASVDVITSDVSISLKYENTAPYAVDYAAGIKEWKDKVQNKDKSVFEMFMAVPE